MFLFWLVFEWRLSFMNMLQKVVGIDDGHIQHTTQALSAVKLKMTHSQHFFLLLFACKCNFLAPLHCKHKPDSCSSYMQNANLYPEHALKIFSIWKWPIWHSGPFLGGTFLAHIVWKLNFPVRLGAKPVSGHPLVSPLWQAALRKALAVSLPAPQILPYWNRSPSSFFFFFFSFTHASPSRAWQASYSVN